MTTNNQKPSQHGPHGPGCRCGMEQIDLCCATCGVPLPTEGTACGECMMALPSQPTRIYCKPCGFKHITCHLLAQTLGVPVKEAAADIIEQEIIYRQGRIKQQKVSLN